MKVLYGLNRFYDGSSILKKGFPLAIPPTDEERFALFNHDPEFGTVKLIKVIDDYEIEHVLEVGSTATLTHDEHGKGIVVRSAETSKQPPVKFEDIQPTAEKRLREIHASLKLLHGSFDEEFPEQILATTFIKPTNKVLELGANIGRNTLVLSRLLEKSSQLTTLESHPYIVNQLYENKKQNNLDFTIVDSALSKRRLIQRNWITQPIYNGAAVPDGWQIVNTITWADVQARHGPFDTLVADCEGALYFILQDEPNMLKDFHTIIVENDYKDITHYTAVIENFKKHGFTLVLSHEGGWGPCQKMFFQVWQRVI